MRIIMACAAALALFLGLTTPVDATTIRRLDLDTLVASADVIVLGVAGKGETVTRGKRFVTRTPLTPERIVKGALDGPLVVETAGGRSGVIGQRVAGVARFAEGEQAVVFLTRLPSGAYRVRGMAQGKLTVVPGVSGGRAVRDLSGLRLIGPDGAPVGDAAQTMPLDDFLRDLAVRLARDRVEPGVKPGDAVPAAPADGEVAR